MSLAFRQAELALERRFEDRRHAVRPLAGLRLTHAEEERHDVERGIDFEPEKDKKQFVARSAQDSLSAGTKRAHTSFSGAKNGSRLFCCKPCFVKGDGQCVEFTES